MKVSRHDGVVRLAMDRGRTNALGLEDAQELSDRLKGLAGDDRARSVVLASESGTFFSIGFDVPRLFRMDREAFRSFYDAFSRTCLDLYAFPKPAVAEVSGHAAAGGCVLALCCDYRVAGRGRWRIGLNEIRLGVPVPHLADALLRNLAGLRAARDLTDGGGFLGPEQALEAGLLDELVPAGDAAGRAMEKARELGSMPGRSFARIKRNRTEAIRRQVLDEWEEQQQYFVDCWFHPDTRERLEKVMERFEPRAGDEVRE